MDQRPKPRIWNGDNAYDSDEDDDEKNQSVLTFASVAGDAHMR